jgi:hypothetical protein
MVSSTRRVRQAPVWTGQLRKEGLAVSEAAHHSASMDAVLIPQKPNLSRQIEEWHVIRLRSVLGKRAKGQAVCGEGHSQRIVSVLFSEPADV